MENPTVSSNGEVAAKSRLICINAENLGTPEREYRPEASRVLEGDIVCRNWDLDNAKNGTIRAGIFESSPGVNRSIKGEAWEFCLIVKGVAEVTEDGHAPQIFKAGDSFIMQPGYLGVWRTIETVRKIWVMG